MKRILLLMLLAVMLASVTFVYARSDSQHLTVNHDIKHHTNPMRPDLLAHFISVNPQTIMSSYYDYMIGGYKQLPIKKVPDSAGGGYFLTYHGQMQSNSQRYAYYAYIGNDGLLDYNHLLTDFGVREGYPSLDIDPLSGKPLFAWHGLMGTDNMSCDVMYAWDVFLAGTPGMLSNPDSLVDCTQPPYDTSEYLWPEVFIGPSPTAGMRRAYITVSSSTSSNGDMSLFYADFNATMIESDQPLQWNTTAVRIPLLQQWVQDTTVERRVCMTLVPAEDGKVYYIGWHSARNAGTNEPVNEDMLDCFVNTNYGVGEWTHYSASGVQPTWYPDDEEGVYTFQPTNAMHFNVVLSDGKLRFPLLYSLHTLDAGDDAYFNQYHSIRSVSFDTNNHTFDIDDLYPQGMTPWSDPPFTPWDVNEDHVRDVDENGDPVDAVCWPFCYWDSSSHDNSMLFNYNFLRMTEPSTHGIMATVWEDSQNALDNPNHPAVPEIFISISPDHGFTWYEPIRLSSVLNPQLAGQIPMWVYPADKIEELSYTSPMQFSGKLYLMYYDDNSWGSESIAIPSPLVPMGGEVKYMAINFSTSVANDDQTQTQITMLAQNSPNPFCISTDISFSLPKQAKASLSIYNVKGELIRSLCEDSFSKGSHTVNWDGKDKSGNPAAGGVYFYRLTADGKTETRKMLLLK